MSIVELATSRDLEITVEGTSIERHFSCTKTDWNAGTDGPITLPKIGDVYLADGIEREDLRVTHIRVSGLYESGTEVRVLVTYSTENNQFKSNSVDSTNSMAQTFDFQTVVKSAENYMNYDDGKPKVWKEVWTAASDATYTRTHENAPLLDIHLPNLVYTYKVNVSTWNYNTIIDNIGSINSTDFIKQFKTRWGSGSSQDLYDATGDDKGKWLFTGFHAEQVGAGNAELTLTFLFREYPYYESTGGDLMRGGWNKPYGVDANLYKEVDFYTVIPIPEDEGVAPYDGLKG